MSGLNFSDDDIRDFTVEATDMLDEAEANLLKIERGGDYRTLYDSIFRVFHSLKGGAGMLGLEALQKHMHSLENIFSSLKSKPTLSNDETYFFLGGIDATRQIILGNSVTFDYEVKQKDPGQTESFAKNAPSDETHTGTNTAKGLAFLIDDEPDISEALAAILEHCGFKARTFTDPVAALATIKETPPDVVFTDLKMPKMSGLELLQAIKAIHADVPVIIVSAHITTDTLLSAIRSSVFAAIEKPFDDEIVRTYALNAVRQHHLTRLFRRGLNLLLYQFADLEDFLRANGKEDVANTARNELNTLLAQWKEMSAGRAEK